MGDDRNPKSVSAAFSSLPGRPRTESREQMCVLIKSDRDIITARQKGKDLGARLGFSNTDLTLIATAISELARNIVIYAKTGEIILKPLRQGDRKGIVVVANDTGPGIPDIPRALQDGFSTSRSLGLGLPGVRRLMDAFEINSQVNRGTTVTVTKWTLPKLESIAPRNGRY